MLLACSSEGVIISSTDPTFLWVGFPTFFSQYTEWLVSHVERFELVQAYIQTQWKPKIGVNYGFIAFDSKHFKDALCELDISVLCVVMLILTWQCLLTDLDPQSNLSRELIGITRSPESNPSYFPDKLMPWWQTWLSKINDAGAETAQLREPILYCMVSGKHSQCIIHFPSHIGTVTPILKLVLLWGADKHLASKGGVSKPGFGATLYFTV